MDGFAAGAVADGSLDEDDGNSIVAGSGDEFCAWDTGLGAAGIEVGFAIGGFEKG